LAASYSVSLSSPRRCSDASRSSSEARSPEPLLDEPATVAVEAAGVEVIVGVAVETVGLLVPHADVAGHEEEAAGAPALVDGSGAYFRKGLGAADWSGS